MPAYAMDIDLALSNNFLCAFFLCIVLFIVLRQPLVELDQIWGTIVCATRVDKDDDTNFHEPLYTATKCLQLQKIITAEGILQGKAEPQTKITYTVTFTVSASFQKKQTNFDTAS